jgi:hypothetical protein
MLEMMQPSLSTIIVDVPDLRSLVTIVSFGIVGLSAVLLVLETIAFYWFPDDTKSGPVGPSSVVKENKDLKFF